MAKKKKRRSRRAKARARKAAANPIVRGQETFHRGDYDGAIAAWEQARQENPSPTLTAALAEVYFRRGLLWFYRWQKHDAGLSDLDKAAHLISGDPRYTYHLGLARHRQDNLSAAITAYRLVLDADPAFTRAAELAVLVLLEQGRDPTQDAAWRALPSEQQAELSPLIRLVLDQPAALVSEGPVERQNSPPKVGGTEGGRCGRAWSLSNPGTTALTTHCKASPKTITNLRRRVQSWHTLWG